MTVVTRNCVRVSGPEGARPMVLAHGYGCDQTMWRALVPEFAVDHRVVTFDHVGAGGSDVSAYDPVRHGTLRGYAEDLLDVVRELDLTDVVLVGHSVSAMIGVLAVRADPGRFGALVMIGPSPRYVDDEDYTGGFSRADVAALLESLDSNPAQWAAGLAAVVAGPDHPDVAAELAESFCRTDPRVARDFARVTFLSDNRTDLPAVRVPTLVLQCSDDAIAPEPVGRFVHAQVPGSVFRRLSATGHCPHLSAPEETTAAIRAFLGGPVGP
ncbi:alpha/beta fold hydrolase [Geodermatophilus sp. SYSU D01045]